MNDTEAFDEPKHMGFTCDGCMRTCFTGPRYSCRNCKNFNLCEDCHTHPERLPIGPHNPSLHTLTKIEPSSLGVLLETYIRFTESKAKLEPGDIVRWKKGFRNKTLPCEDGVAVVVETFPALHESPDSDTPMDFEYFMEPYDCRLGVIESGKFMIFHYDSRRFEVVKKKENST